MEKGIIKIGDKIRFNEDFISFLIKDGVIKLGEEKWWYETHIVTKVGYEDERCRPIDDLENYDGVLGDEYVIFDNDDKTYSNTCGDDMIILK